MKTIVYLSLVTSSLFLGACSSGLHDTQEIYSPNSTLIKNTDLIDDPQQISSPKPHHELHSQNEVTELETKLNLKS